MTKRLLISMILLTICATISAEDGSQLWLRYGKANADSTVKADALGLAYTTSPKKGISLYLRPIPISLASPTERLAANELNSYWHGNKITLTKDSKMPDNDGFRLHNDTISAAHEIGLLYGAYELLRQQQETGKSICPDFTSYPAFKLRMMNHWDNIDGSVERGYAGKSIFKWEQIDEKKGTMTPALKARLTEYARANASIGINAITVNNVNAQPAILTRAYIYKVKMVADLLRPYGIKVFISINFASPMALGDTKTADPLDPKVSKWWTAKAKEIYKRIPDFGGFLVKANSEGQPGPGDYHRTHAEGANMLADAVAPFGGTIIWRSFVYGANHPDEDRVKQAVSEFKGLDGQFRDNVILQSKNGPLDFQPREPYAPIFDNMKKTPQMAELQITQEYTGQSLHLVYLATMWKEFFSFVNPNKLIGVAGVANIGDETDWCGHPFSQANWYAFGRLAWNPNLEASDIATEWLTQTFNNNDYFVSTMREVMMTSREACVNYMMPLGLHHIFKFDGHYGPEPDGYIASYPMEWNPIYYLRADHTGIGFDRTTTGSNAVSQYPAPYDSLYNNLATCPEEYLLWFHHLPWDYRMKSGKTLWQELNEYYNKGVDEVSVYLAAWQGMVSYVDEQRWREVDKLLNIQLDNAKEWRDVCLGYFQKASKINSWEDVIKQDSSK